MLIEACHLKSVTKSVDLFKNTIILSLLYCNSINKSPNMCSINLSNNWRLDLTLYSVWIIQIEFHIFNWYLEVWNLIYNFQLQWNQRLSNISFPTYKLNLDWGKKISRILSYILNHQFIKQILVISMTKRIVFMYIFTQNKYTNLYLPSLNVRCE